MIVCVDCQCYKQVSFIRLSTYLCVRTQKYKKGDEMETQFSLFLVDGEVITFPSYVLKYIGTLNDLRELGCHSFSENVDFRLTYPLWQLINFYLTVFDSGVSILDNQATILLFNLETEQLYEMARIANYYHIPVVLDIVLKSLVVHLIGAPIEFLLKASHIITDDDFLEGTSGPLERINFSYTYRRQLILNVLEAHVKTYDIVRLVDEQFLPRTTNVIGSSDEKAGIMIATGSGVYVHGDNEYGQLGVGVENKDWLAGYDEEDDTLPVEFPDMPADFPNAETRAQWQQWNVTRKSRPDWPRIQLPVDAISIASGRIHTVLMTTAGLYGCGSNGANQLGGAIDPREAHLRLWFNDGEGDKTYYFLPVQLNFPFGSTVLLVACGSYFTMLYTKDGLYATGYNGRGQMGLPPQEEFIRSFTRVPFDGGELAALACGSEFTVVLTKGGRVYATGFFGEAGQKRYLSFPELSHVETTERVVSISASCQTDYVLLLDANGDVYSLGWNWYGALGTPATRLNRVPVKIMGLPPIATIVATNYYSFFIEKEGDGLYVCGIRRKEYRVMKRDQHRLKKITTPDKVITLAVVRRDLYLLTCSGVYVHNKKQGFATEASDWIKVALQLSPFPICGSSSSSWRQQQGMGCHQCGEKNYTALGYHKGTGRVFCHTKACLNEYKAWPHK